MAGGLVQAMAMSVCLRNATASRLPASKQANLTHAGARPRRQTAAEDIGPPHDGERPRLK